MSQLRVKDWMGKALHKKKRGFSTEKGASQWERDFISQTTGSLSMTFKDEFHSFIERIKERTSSSTIFVTMYYTGIREGELLALTPADIDLEKKTLTVNKSYQRLNGEDVVASPKTPKRNRTIPIPDGLCTCLKEYMSHCYELQPDDRIFPYTKSFLYQRLSF